MFRYFNIRNFEISKYSFRRSKFRPPPISAGGYLKKFYIHF